MWKHKNTNPYQWPCIQSYNLLRLANNVEIKFNPFNTEFYCSVKQSTAAQTHHILQNALRCIYGRRL